MTGGRGAGPDGVAFSTHGGPGSLYAETEQMRAVAAGREVPLDGLDPAAALDRAIADSPADLRPRLRALITERGDPGALLTPEHLDALERVGVAASAALLLDLARAVGEA